MLNHYRHPESIISTDALQKLLGDPELRLFDCTMHLVADSDDAPYRVVSGRDDYLQGHIPGAAHIDLQADLSDPDSPYRFTVPSAAVLVKKLAALGVGDQSRVVLYSANSMQWATRVWWMLRSVGVNNAAVLDGGFQKWNREQKPTDTTPHQYPSASLQGQPVDGLFCDRHEVQRASKQADSVVINALSAELHRGDSARYGRAGRIPGSVNVAAATLQAGDAGTLLPAPEAAALFSAAGATLDKKLVIYCGGGIAATLDAFVLHQLGCDDISVYDHSLNEWAQDHQLPMEVDNQTSA